MLRKPNGQIVEEMVALAPVRRLAGFGNRTCFITLLMIFYPPFLLGSLTVAVPRAWRYMNDVLRALIHHDPRLRRPFANSAYPAFAINYGPRTVCADHRDHGNAPGVPCSITALGEFDHQQGGHLVLFDLKLMIQFPSGSTILIPSGSLRHGNTDIGLNETRTSFTQFCPGALLRYYEYGFRNKNQIPEEDKAMVMGDHDANWSKVLARFSLDASLHQDRMDFLSIVI